MQSVLASLIPHHALVWMDDVILFVDNMEDLLQVLKEFFQLMVPHNLKLNLPRALSTKLQQSGVAD